MESQTGVSFTDTQTAFTYKSDKDLRMAYWIFSLIQSDWFTAIAKSLFKVAMFLHLPVFGIIRSTVFRHFCGGDNIQAAESTILHLGKFGVKTILDYSVEGEDTEEDFEHTVEEILMTLEKAKDKKEIPFCVFKISGIAESQLLEHIQKGLSLNSEEQLAYARVVERVSRICSRAYDYAIPVLIDAEETWIQNTIDRIAETMMQQYNTKSAIVFNTCQLYKKNGIKNLRDAFHNATMHNYFLGVKLVRGAYMEKERDRAEEENYEDPIHRTKEDTDNDFNEALSFCISNKQRITLMCGSHNEYSNYYLTILMEKHGMRPDDKRVWFAQLYGMSDNISFVLASYGYNVAKYVPFGPVKSVMPYLFRRAEENTSVAGQSSRELELIKREMRRRGLSRL